MCLSQKTYFGLEFIALFFLLPAGLRLLLPGRFLLPLLWAAAAVCLAWLWRRPDFQRTEFWSFAAQGRNVLRILARFLVLAIAMTTAVSLFAPELLFALVRERPVLWLMIMLLYPLLSAYPQGIVYRGFIFRRYQSLFPDLKSITVASAAAFAMLHLVFGNFPAVGLSFIGGLIFAQTYRRTNSLAVSWLEHSLYGCFIFTIGLGCYFYHGR